MPASIGAIITGLEVTAATATSAAVTTTTIFGVTVGIATVNTVVGAAVILGAEFGLNALLTASQKAQQQQVTTRQAIPPRHPYYGRNKASGPVAFQQSLNGNLYQVILVAPHQIRFVEDWIGDRKVTLDADGNVTGPDSMVRDGSAVFRIIHHDGADDQAPDALLMEKFPDLWTENHRLRGIAYVVFVQYGVKSKYLTTFYPGGPQNYRAVFDGRKIYDLTDPAQSWDDPSGWDFGNDNAANVLWDFHLNRDGMRLPSHALVPALDDWKSEAAAAAVPTPLAAGGTTARWRLAGGYDLTDQPKTTLGKMVTACDADVFIRGDGAVSCRLGRWDDPAVTIDDTILRSFTLPKGLGPLRSANQVRATFVDPSNDYQAVEAQPWRDEGDISTYGLKDASPLDLSWVPIHNQARRIQKITAARLNPLRAGPITMNLAGLELLTEKRLRLVTTRRNIDMTAEITNSFGLDLTSMTVSTTVSAISADAYAFDAATEEGTVPGGQDLSQDVDVEQPTDVVAVAQLSAYGSGVTAGTIKVTCDTPMDRTDLQFAAEYRTHDSGVSDDDAVWNAIKIGDTQFQGTTGVLALGSYDLRCWFIAPAGAVSEYVYVRDIEITNSGDYLTTDGSTYLVMAPGTYWKY